MTYYQNHVGEDRALERIDEALQDNGIEEGGWRIMYHKATLEEYSSECFFVKELFTDFKKGHITGIELAKFLLGAYVFVTDRDELREELKFLRELLYKHEGY